MRRNPLYGLWIVALVAVLIGTGIVTAQTGGLNENSVDPVYDEISLSAGFSPNPLELPAVQGRRNPNTATHWITTDDEVNVRAQDTGRGCLGYTSTAPTVRLHWSGSSNWLRISFESSSDTTLIVYDPLHSVWLCNDDDSNNNRNPAITITDSSEGLYDIWVASYSRQAARGGLTITEITERDLHP